MFASAKVDKEKIKKSGANYLVIENGISLLNGTRRYFIFRNIIFDRFSGKTIEPFGKAFKVVFKEKRTRKLFNGRLVKCDYDSCVIIDSFGNKRIIDNRDVGVNNI